MHLINWHQPYMRAGANCNALVMFGLLGFRMFSIVIPKTIGTVVPVPTENQLRQRVQVIGYHGNNQSSKPSKKQQLGRSVEAAVDLGLNDCQIWFESSESAAWSIAIWKPHSSTSDPKDGRSSAASHNPSENFTPCPSWAIHQASCWVWTFTILRSGPPSPLPLQLSPLSPLSLLSLLSPCPVPCHNNPNLLNLSTC